jgi:hypothetical protein
MELNADRPDVRPPRCLDREPWRAVSLFHPSGRKLVTTMAKGLMTNDGLTEPFSDSHRCTSGCLEPATTGRTGARRRKGRSSSSPSRSSQNHGPNRRGRCGSWPPSRRALHPPRHPVGTLSGAPCPAGPHSRRWSCRPSHPVGCRPSPPLLLACAKKMRLAAFNPTRGLCRVLRVRCRQVGGPDGAAAGGR